VAANFASGEVKPFFSRRRIMAAAVVVLLALFVVRPGVSRLKTRIVSSISQAVGRRAEIGSVHLRFLPRPGFDLENLVIYEDPAFGAEPMLRAPEVTAVVRLTSLMRGRLDISRLELTEPSLNLTRREDGRWDWEGLLERTARTPLAPTAKSKAEARPGFPYIEASSGRINFKAGTEKKPYALLNADFALWQDSENTWGVRLKAEPLRADMSLSDTGVVRMNGTWQRAGSLRETPLQFTIDWQHAQLGQLTKLVYGNDKGWRGDVQVEAALRGTPAALEITTDATVRDFHRYDIYASEGLAMVTHCDGKYSSAEHMMQEIFCTAPVGNGMFTLHGSAGAAGAHRLDLSLNVENVPANAVAQLARRTKKDLPSDLVAAGSVQGNFSAKENGPSSEGPQFEGRGEITNLRLQSSLNKAELVTARVPFVLSVERNSRSALARGKNARQVDMDAAPATNEMHIEFGPFPIALGRPVPLQAKGWLGRSGYAIAVRGDAEVSHALKVGSLLGLPAMRANVEGATQLDLQIAGSWTENTSQVPAGFSLPQVTGTAQLHDVRATVRGVNGPVEITSAELKLEANQARVEKLSARAAESRWTGSVDLPRGCGTPRACMVHFNLNTEEVRLSDVRALLGGHQNQRRWYQVLSPAEPRTPSFLSSLRASGKINAGRLRVHNVLAEDVSAVIDVDGGKLKISDLRGDLLGGKHRGDWQGDFTSASPVYTGSGTVTNIALEQIASAMHEGWITGTGSGTYQLKTSSLDSTTFWQSAEGSLHFDLRDGAFSLISLGSEEKPLRVERWHGHALLRDGKVEIEKGTLISPGGAYEVSGTASLAQELDFKLSAGTQAKSAGAGSLVYSITGTLTEPHIAVTPAPETQARLKP
jgi:hypothetical protein